MVHTNNSRAREEGWADPQGSLAILLPYLASSMPLGDTVAGGLGRRRKRGKWLTWDCFMTSTQWPLICTRPCTQVCTPTHEHTKENSIVIAGWMFSPITNVLEQNKEKRKKRFSLTDVLRSSLKSPVIYSSWQTGRRSGSGRFPPQGRWMSYLNGRCGRIRLVPPSNCYKNFPHSQGLVNNSLPLPR